MNEKIYKTMSGVGLWSLVLGIVSLICGVAIGVMSIVNGARLLRGKGKLLF